MREPADGAVSILSKNVIGHGAASAAILRVDLDNELAVAQTRNEAGPDQSASVDTGSKRIEALSERCWVGPSGLSTRDMSISALARPIS